MKDSFLNIVDIFIFFFNQYFEGSIPREIASFLGSAIFREYKWTATAEFALTLPTSF